MGTDTCLKAHAAVKFGNVEIKEYKKTCFVKSLCQGNKVCVTGKEGVLESCIVACCDTDLMGAASRPAVLLWFCVSCCCL